LFGNDSAKKKHVLIYLIAIAFFGNINELIVVGGGSRTATHLVVKPCVLMYIYAVTLIAFETERETERESSKNYEVYFIPKIFKRGGGLETDASCSSFLY